jgi:arylsulfatase A-like enzyme
VASTELIVKPERRPAGAAALGAVGVIAVLGLLAAGLPLQRLLARVTEKLPAIGGLTRTAEAAIVAGALLLYWVRRVVYHAGYDLEALPLGGLTMFVLLPVLTIALAAICSGPLSGVRTRLPARGALVAGGAAAAVVLAALSMRQPGEAVARSVTDKGAGSSLVVVLGRKFIDRDGDGYSAFFRGPDCDDGRKDVNPGAKEVPNNGVDDNCQGGDYTGSAAAGSGTGSGAGTGTGTGTGTGSGSGTGTGTGTGTGASPRGLASNVVIIMIDTLRADRLGAVGYRRDGASISPRIDDLLAKSIWFRHVYAQANNTPRSIPSFLASRYPTALAVDKIHAKYSRVDDANDLLFEQLRAAGLRTIGVASHFYFNPERNITQGFDVFDNEGALDVKGSNKDIAAPRIVPRVVAQLAELAQSRTRFAMFVHLFEPHSSFVAHDGDPEVTEGGTAKWSRLYDYEVKFVDAYVGKILDAIDASALAEDTVVVLMSDHGEAFGEHSFAGQSMFHGTNLYDPQIRVPLAFRVPGQAPRQVDTVAELLDLAPTVAALVGAAPSPTWMGRSLVPAITGGVLEPRPAFSELLAYPGWEHDIKVAVSADGAWKLHHILSQRRRELYRLSDDPGEDRDLFGKPEVAAEQQRMIDLLNELVEVRLAQ